MLMNLTGGTGTLPVRRSGLTLDCGTPAPLWFCYRTRIPNIGEIFVASYPI